MTTTPKLTRRDEIMVIIHDHPGQDALALRQHGLQPRDGKILRELEGLGWIAYKGTPGGWYLTVKGDTLLLEKLPMPEPATDVQAGG